MSVLEAVAVAVGALWLLVLTLVCLLLVRQVAILGLQVERGAHRETPATAEPLEMSEDQFQDGLPVGTEIPEPVADLIPGIREDLHVLLVLSGSCGPCRDLAPLLSQARPAGALTVLVPGRPALADQMVALIGDIGTPVVRGDHADAITAALRVTSTPSMTVVRDGLLAGTRFVRRVDELAMAATVSGTPAPHDDPAHEVSELR
jgi:hypothetical protein